MTRAAQAGQERQSDGQAYIRPASDDSVPLRQHLEKLIDDLRLHFDASITAQAKRFDDLRAADNDRITAAFTARREALEAALKDQTERTHVALVANEKRLDALNELRKGVAMTVEIQAVDTKVDRVEKGFDKLESKLEGRSGGLKDYIAWILAAVAIAGFVVSVVVRQ